MREGSLVETGKFTVLTILVFLLITVAAILLQPSEVMTRTYLQSSVLRTLSSVPNLPVPRDVQGATVYRFPDSSTVVFLEYPVFHSQLACAVQFSPSGSVQNVRITAPILPPASLRIEALLEHAANLTVAKPVGILSSEERAAYLDVLDLLRHAADIAKKAGAS